jgi:hypothetical protein
MPSQSTFIVAICLRTALSLSNLTAEPIRLQSTEQQAGLLELYSSEGCSSCPPAESWLSGLKKCPNLWRSWVPVAFHVDYWDSLGWKDPFGLKEFSARQHEYADLWQSQSVYTPGFVFNGREWRGWFQSQAFPLTTSKRVGVLQGLSADGSSWTFTFKPTGSAALETFEFHAALLGFELTSEVKAGENRGRKLEHDFVVLKLGKAASRRTNDRFQANITLQLPGGLIATKPRGIAVWVTLANNPEPLQAVGGWLPSAVAQSR